MKIILYNRITQWVAAVFILLFVYTAVSKLSNPILFRLSLSKSPLVGNVAGLVSWALPAVELSIAALLFFPATRIYGLWSSLFIMILFTDYLAAMIIFAPELPCSCGGVLREMSWRQHLVFNAAFTVLAALGVWAHRRSMIQLRALLQ